MSVSDIRKRLLQKEISVFYLEHTISITRMTTESPSFCLITWENSHVLLVWDDFFLLRNAACINWERALCLCRVHQLCSLTDNRMCSESGWEESWRSEKFSGESSTLWELEIQYACCRRLKFSFRSQACGLLLLSC